MANSAREGTSAAAPAAAPGAKALWWGLLVASVSVGGTLAALVSADAPEGRAWLLGPGVFLVLFLLTGAYPLWRLVAAKKPTRAVVFGHEPLLEEPSPVPWVSDEVWQRRKQWSRFPGLRGPGDEEQTLFDVGPEAVGADERARAPVAPLTPGAPVPEPLPVDRMQLDLESTPDVGAFWNPVDWPVCCDRLATLAVVNPTQEELHAWESKAGRLERLAPEGLEDAWAHELGLARAGRTAEFGVNVFQCRACGRLYGRYTHT